MSSRAAGRRRGGRSEPNTLVRRHAAVGILLSRCASRGARLSSSLHRRRRGGRRAGCLASPRRHRALRRALTNPTFTRAGSPRATPPHDTLSTAHGGREGSALQMRRHGAPAVVSSWSSSPGGEAGGAAGLCGVKSDAGNGRAAGPLESASASSARRGVGVAVGVSRPPGAAGGIEKGPTQRVKGCWRAHREGRSGC